MNIYSRSLSIALLGSTALLLAPQAVAATAERPQGSTWIGSPRRSILSLWPSPYLGTVVLAGSAAAIGNRMPAGRRPSCRCRHPG